MTTYRLDAGGTLVRPEVAERRPGRALLDPARRRPLLRLEHGQQHAQLVPDRRVRPAGAAASVAATTNPGAIDLTSSGRYLYAETGRPEPSTSSASARTARSHRSGASTTFRPGSRASRPRRRASGAPLSLARPRTPPPRPAQRRGIVGTRSTMLGVDEASIQGWSCRCRAKSARDIPDAALPRLTGAVARPLGHVVEPLERRLIARGLVTPPFPRVPRPT